MSSREEILASIRQHTQTRYDKPDIADMKRLSYPDKIEQFCAISRAVGGTAVVLGEGEDVNAVIRRTYPDAMRIASVLPDISCATFNPDNLDDPKELDGTDVAVVKGEIGVAENGAIWIPQTVKYKAIYFISEKLVILLDRNKIVADSPSSTEFAQALFNSYRNRDLSAFLMAICQNTVFDLLRNAFLIPYRFNADGKQNPMIMTDENGMLLPEYKRSIHEREYRHFHEVYTDLGAPKNIFLAQAYRYSHSYTSDDMEPEQNILEKNNGVLLIRELPDTVKLKETEAEAYSAILDIVIKLQKELPMSYVFYGQDSLVEDNTRYDEIGVFLPNSHFLKNLERHVSKAEAIIYADN